MNDVATIDDDSADWGWYAWTPVSWLIPGGFAGWASAEAGSAAGQATAYGTETVVEAGGDVSTAVSTAYEDGKNAVSTAYEDGKNAVQTMYEDGQENLDELREDSLAAAERSVARVAWVVPVTVIGSVAALGAIWLGWKFVR